METTNIDNSNNSNSNNNKNRNINNSSNSDSTDNSNNNQTCPICLSPMTNTTSVVGCQHAYCLECIDNWIKNKVACPLCKAENDNRIIEVTPPPKPHPSTVEVDLGCLDHTYFLEELIKLFRLRDSVGLMIESAPPVRNPNSKVYLAGTNQSDALELLTITDNMTRLRDDLSRLEPFDPEDILSHIYTIETALNELKTFYTNHNNFKTSLSHSSNSSRYNDYYYDDDDDEYEGEYDEDEQRYLDGIAGARRHNKSAYESPSLKKQVAGSTGGGTPKSDGKKR
ncbi:hypothetical protein DFA_00976 [Cavenderia fasciculata]|uniref:RING-type domain-containing protein n=1 Tax=Cavenderia fasciculata TaxID=261658 RepID=F4PUT2_CACFS|nr:uncharacterized protein DFA_00976 [Cavenderia fasciculata]EGG21101.1 hypothetical protein DFA_00976 [Cavenderia fasciculata]|eukprot:XP_004358951.1 hypothetical protein DFA_00976 [Cavenderia fasciculata]